MDSTTSAEWRRPPEPVLTRLLAAAVIVFFCIPLFIGLGHADLENDEPIYSYAVEQMLRHGDWMTPRYIPSDGPFLEKPPLKFWLIAGAIQAGVLPDNEFGHRFWDALFGAVAFLYVFAIAHRLAGPVAGFLAVMVLFAQQALIVDHGLRSNNMEAALVLAYCGGVYHALAWSATKSPRARALHPQAVAGYFVLGFMTKFVAVAFLPLVIAIVALTDRAWRRRLREDWKWWTTAAAVATALTVPWFAHQTWEWGTVLWDVILGEHVVERMRVSIDPGHIRPWHFYWTRTLDEILANGTAPLILVGLALLSWRTLQRRWDAGALMLAWLIVPLVIISAGRGKLYHYVYPFLPPLAIAAGYGAVALFESASPVRRPLEGATRWLSARVEFLRGRRSAARAALITIAVVSIAVALWTVLVGRFALRLGDVVLFRNRSVVRPMAAAALALVLAGSSRQAAHVVLAVLVIGSLGGYAGSLRRLDDGHAQLQRLRACLAQQFPDPTAARVYGHGEPGQWRYVYYFLPLGWTNDGPPDDARVVRSLTVPAHAEPVLITSAEYARLRQAHGLQATIPDVHFNDGRRLLLPGRFGACASSE